YTRRWVDKMNDRRKSSLWIMNADGSRNRFLTEGSSPRWSPDGSRIAFVRQGDPKGSQIFVRWMDAEGATSQITRVEKSPGDVRWSPDGESIAFTMLVPHKEPWPIKLPGRPEGAKWTAAPKVVTWLNYRRDRIGFTDEGFRHIFLVPATGGTPRQLTSGDWSHSGPEWTPDGSEILFSSLRIEEAEYQFRESEIYAVNFASGDIRQITTRHGPDYNPVVSPNGQLVAYSGYDWTDDTFIERKLYVMNIDGSNPREIATDLDRSPGNITWASNNRGVYFTANDRGTTHLYYAPLRGETRKLTDGDYRLFLSSVSDDGEAVGTMTSFHEPGDVVGFNLRNPEPRKLTDVNGDVLHGVTLGEVEEIWYKSVDDFDIQGWIIKPPDFDPNEKYPLILAIHGGPHAMYSVGFNFSWQNHAAKGYVVLYTNPRGSSGYGSAFGNAIKNAYPDKDFNDLMAGVDEVIARGYIDERNLFVYGGSGGGVLTAWIVGHTDRFAAASSNYPVIDWLSFVGTTDGTYWYRNFQKLPWEDPSEHLRRSPLMYVDNVKTPTMLMTGIKDLRTPISQTEEFYQALRFLKVPTAMIRFNDEWHGTSSRPSNLMRSMLYLRSWFERYMTKDERPKAGGASGR
ncbi:MAG: prolyl oligopeptidase family serine peptidase, partial [Gemmatimonadales bacterium]|nr:prolyl oligopeptidase family serine peptidase [Gemmatimonadales bacterium]NIN13055.1 prolyl oligopeptidase family serine peptidase [Gemmatimonadales bacterium]NIN51139.1 prolyl oligopeptidase family serine peptidase [Gemmatimonadales bacterium]NIP08603.1 prolyl oligopeptidase family serine peptidase [Gemmatimonadales bacterium]NIR02291.1 prolyl oligopeptidase family serine peptidase [Gemmatimonadales bacterium]